MTYIGMMIERTEEFHPNCGGPASFDKVYRAQIRLIDANGSKVLDDITEDSLEEVIRKVEKVVPWKVLDGRVRGIPPVDSLGVPISPREVTKANKLLADRKIELAKQRREANLKKSDDYIGA